MARGQHLLWWFKNTKDELLNPPWPRYMIQNVSMDTFLYHISGPGCAITLIAWAIAHNQKWVIVLFAITGIAINVVMHNIIKRDRRNEEEESDDEFHHSYFRSPSPSPFHRSPTPVATRQRQICVFLCEDT